MKTPGNLTINLDYFKQMMKEDQAVRISWQRLMLPMARSNDKITRAFTWLFFTTHGRDARATSIFKALIHAGLSAQKP